MVNFNANLNSNNTNLRKDTAGNASRARLKDRRAERAIEDAAAEAARIQALQEQLEAERANVEGGSKEEMRQLNKDLRDLKKKVGNAESSGMLENAILRTQADSRAADSTSRGGFIGGQRSDGTTQDCAHRS